MAPSSLGNGTVERGPIAITLRRGCWEKLAIGEVFLSAGRLGGGTVIQNVALNVQGDVGGGDQSPSSRPETLRTVTAS